MKWYMINLTKNIIKKFTICTISTKSNYFKEWTTVLHYQQHKNRLFCTIYICPHFFYKNLVFYITEIWLIFIKLEKHYLFIKYFI